MDFSGGSCGRLGSNARAASRRHHLNTDQPLSRYSFAAEPTPEAAAAIPHYYLPSTISLTQGILMLRAHWRPSVIILLSVTVFAAVVVKFLPKSYTATTTLIVNSENKNPLAWQLYPLDPMAVHNYWGTPTE